MSDAEWVPRTLRRLHWAIWVFLFVCAGGAAWTLPRWPLISALLMFVVVAVGALQARAIVAARRIDRAGLRCDVDALEALSTRDGSLDCVARGVFVHHGGFDRPLRFPPLCSCDDDGCPTREIDREIARMHHVARAAWVDDTADRDAAIRALEEPSSATRDALFSFRVMELVLAHATSARALAEDDLLTEEELALFRSSFAVMVVDLENRRALRWPARLAAAREAAAFGESARVRELLAGMPGWPAGSTLEAVRRELAASAA